MEYLSQYEYSITYIKGEDNTVADTLLQIPNVTEQSTAVNAIFGIESNPKLFRRIRKGYIKDSWCAGILKDMKHNVMDSKLGFELKNRLLFIGSRLIIPKYKDM